MLKNCFDYVKPTLMVIDNKYKVRERLKLNKQGISTLVEVAGVMVIVVAAIILVLPQAKSAISSIWTTVTNNAKTFFNDNTK